MKEKDYGYGALGVLSKEEAYWEELVDMCKELPTLEAIGRLRLHFYIKHKNMAGLNYGHKYKANKGVRMDKKPGVFYNEISKKWIVRVKNKFGQVSTIAQFDIESEAIKSYNKNSDNH